VLGVRGKILLISISVVVLGVGIGTFLNGEAFRKEYTDGLQSKMTVIVRDFRNQLNRIRALGLDIDNIRGFEKQCLDVVHEHPEISYALVARRDGFVLFHSDPTLQGKTSKRLAYLAFTPADQTSIRVVQGDKGEELQNVIVSSEPDDRGDVFVIVGFPSRIITAQVHRLIARSMLFGGVSIALATVLLLASISVLVTQPLSRLVGTIRDIQASGNLRQKVNVRFRDEIGTLATSFNEMIGSLQQAHDELEERVDRRTEELARANQALREREERYRLVAKKTGQLIYDYDIPTGHIQWIGAIEELTGYSPQEFAEVDIQKWEEMIHPQDRRRVMESLEHGLKNHGNTFLSPYRFQHKDGHYFDVEDSAAILRSPQGEAWRMLGTMKDVTLRKEAEDELKHSHELLEQRVQERTKELVQANEHIRQAQAELVQIEKMSLLGELVAGVAHEINTPTGAIMNVANDAALHVRELAIAASELDQLPDDLRRWLSEAVPVIVTHQATLAKLADRQAHRQIESELQRQGIKDPKLAADILIDCGLSSSDERAVRCLSHPVGLKFLEHLAALKIGTSISLASVQKIAKIIRALRYYSRSGDGDLFDINVNESLDNTLVILQNRLKHLVKVERCYEESIPPVLCGPDLSQVWTNILSNACDAIESVDGPGEKLIRITTRSKDQHAVVEIFNIGPPIPPQTLPKIFDPFFTTKAIGKGTGLGLSICTAILRKYQGTIAAHNEPNGVTFEVTLPLDRREATETPPASQNNEALAHQAG